MGSEPREEEYMGAGEASPLPGGAARGLGLGRSRDSGRGSLVWLGAWDCRGVTHVM